MPARGDFVVITTDANKRGVFAGLFFGQDGDTVILQQAQNCLFWSAATKGLLGLAAIGPQPGSRVSDSVPELTVNGVTAIMVATATARTTWESVPWT